MSVAYKYSKLLIKIKQRYKITEYHKAVSKLNAEQLKVFNFILEKAVQNRESIRIDPMETLIVLPDILITLVKYKVVIHNAHGFLTTSFQNDAYDIMYEALKKEEYRERRRLKHEVKIRINDFLNRINVIEEIELIS